MANIETEVFYSTGRLLEPMARLARSVMRAGGRGVGFSTAVRDALRKHPRCAEFVDARPDGLFAVRPEWLFAQWEIAEIVLCNGDARPKELFHLSADFREMMTIVIRLNLDSRSAVELAEDLAVSRGGIIERLLRPPSPGCVRAKLPDYAARGIRRLQHASCLIRSRTTGVVLDPNFQCIKPENIVNTMTARDVVPHADAVLVTHSHGDHFHLGSILHFPKDTPILVPRVPRSSLASIDMRRLLRSAGFVDVRALDWFAKTKIGDIEIQALPFYGEQTSSREEFHRGLINWGNTYLVATPDFTVWPLADSGRDVRGSMVDVAAELRARGRKVDVVLASVAEATISSPLSLGGVIYWLCMSPEQRRRLHDATPRFADLVTLGPSGLLDLAASLRPRWILPYNAGHSNIGRTHAFELSGFREFSRRLNSLGIPVSVHSWAAGDRFLPGRGDRFF